MDKTQMKTDILEKHAVNVEEQTITFSCASDLPYERYDENTKTYYDEVLVMDATSCDVHRLQDGASLLFGHDATRILGAITSSQIIGNKLFVSVKFRKNDPFATSIFKDICDGTIKNVSVGYSVNHYTEKSENERVTRYVDSYMVYEVSIVGIPADETVGIRSLKINPKNKETREMNQEEIDKMKAENEALKAENTVLKVEAKPDEKPAVDAPAEAPAETPAETAQETTVETPAEKPAVQDGQSASVDDGTNGESEEIKKLAKDFDVSAEVTAKAIANKMSVKEFKLKIKTNGFEVVTNKKEKTMKEKMEIREMLLNATKNQGGNIMLRTFSGIGGQTGENGASLIGTETLPLVAIIAKNMALKGYRTLTGLHSNVQIPCQTVRPTITQAATLRTAATATAATFTPRTLSPVKWAAEIVIGKELLVQSNDDIVSFVVDSLTAEIGYKLEAYMLSKIATTAPEVYIAPAAVTWAKILEMESKVSGYALGAKSFAVCPSMYAELKGAEKATGTAQFLCDSDGKVNGYPCVVSGCISDEKLYFGDFSHLILGVFGDGLEILIDPYTYSSTGDIKIVGSICADAVVEQDAAFVLGLEEEGSSSVG